MIVILTRSEASEPKRPDILDLNILRSLTSPGLKLIEASHQAKMLFTVCNNVTECVRDTRTNSSLSRGLNSYRERVDATSKSGHINQNLRGDMVLALEHCENCDAVKSVLQEHNRPLDGPRCLLKQLA